MDMMFMEQHFLRSPLRLYSDMDAENNNSGSLFSAAMMEKARAQLQLWGRGGPAYSPGEMTMIPGYGGGRIPLPAHLWGGQPPWTNSQTHAGLPPGLLGPPMAPRPSQITPPPPTTPSSSSGSPSPSNEMKTWRPVYPKQHQRFSPFQMPKQQHETIPARN